MLRDEESDRAAGVRTTAVALGSRATVALARGLILLAALYAIAGPETLTVGDLAVQLAIDIGCQWQVGREIDGGGATIRWVTAVEIEKFSQQHDMIHIDATILVERAGQKGIVIGKGGERLKKIGTDARQDMEQTFDSRVMLNLWVKVRSGWSDDERALQSLGYMDSDGAES